MKEIMEQKFILRKGITEKQLQNIGLPWKTIKESGVICRGYENQEYIGDDGTIQTSLQVIFDYKEEGKLPKSIFDEYFQETIE